MFKGRRVLCVQLLCAAVFLLASCKSSNDHQGLNGDTDTSRFVRVTVDGSTITCVPDPVTPRRNRQMVVWVSANQISITLPNTYTQPVCRQTGSDWRCTSKTFASLGKIKYDVQANGPNGPKLDPMIDVQP
jgi:hypothetical protein